MKPVTLAAILILSMGMIAHAQQRTLSNKVPSMLRMWPQVGAWQVMLGKSPNKPFTCVLATGQKEQNTEEHYLWGLSRRSTGLSLLIMDHNQAAVSGDKITPVVDGVALGSYKVTFRVEQGDMTTVAALVPPDEASTVLNLFRNGGAVKFQIQDTSYDASLQGAGQAAMNFDACQREATQLEAIQTPVAAETPGVPQQQ